MKLGLTEEQIAERRKGIGGSDKLSRDLWLIKTGRKQEEDLSRVLAVQMGSFTEPLNAYWYELTTGRKVERRNETIISTKYPWMRANLDGVTTTSRGEPAYIDFKHCGKAGDAEVMRYTQQGTHNCIILNLDWWVLSVFVGNSRHEIFEQEVDPFYARELIARERDFWGYVERDEDPGDRFDEKPPVPKPAPKLREIVVPTHPEFSIAEMARAVGNWLPEALSEARTFASTHAAAALHAIVREKIKAIVPDDVGKLQFGLFTYKRDGRGQTLSLAKPEEDDA